MKRPEGFDRPRVPKPPAPDAPTGSAEAEARGRRGSRPAAPVTPTPPPATRAPTSPATPAPTPPAPPRPRAAWRDDDEPDTEPIVLPHLAQAPVEAPPVPRTGREPETSRTGGLAGRLGARARRTAETAAAAKPLRRRTHADVDGEPTPRSHRPARPASAATGDAEARRQLRRARRERQRYERQEVRRFTQRTRRRRAGLLGALGAVLTLAIVVGIAVYSPLLALRTVEVEGADRVSPQSIQAALSDQVGTPLPLVDLDRVGDELRAFPLIRSYSTESRPRRRS